MKTLQNIAFFTVSFYFAPLVDAAVSFQSYQLNTSGLTILPNPFSELEVLTNNQYRFSVTSLYYAPTSLSLIINDGSTSLVVHSIALPPVTSLFVGDPLIPNSGFVAYNWQGTFTASQDLSSYANNGLLFFRFYDDTNSERTDRFYSTIPEPSGLLLCAVALSMSMLQRNRNKCE